MSALIFLEEFTAKSLSKLVFAFILTCFLSACGAGGGSGSEDVADNQAASDAELEEESPVEIDSVQIVSQPQSMTVDTGSTAVFVVDATGGELTYQWRKNQQNIQGAVGKTLTLSNISSADAGLYDVIVSNTQGDVASLSALLTVNDPVVVVPTIDPVAIVSQPLSITVDENSAASFSVAVTGDGEITYQWLKNGEVINGATSATFSFSSVNLSDAGLYSVRVANSQNTVTSTAASLNVTALPEPVAITSQPQAITVDENSAASFSVAVTGDGEITYQWLKDGEVINGATSATFSFPSVTLADAGLYRVRVANSQNTVTSTAASLNVTALPEPVAITSQPQAITVDENSAASFSVAVTGDGEITYQWLKDGEVINGATSATFSFPSVTLEDAGLYSVRVANSQNTVTSTAASLNVTALPEPVAITSQPQAITVDENSAASFSVAVTGDGEITYQWLKDGEVIDGANSATLTIASVNLDDAASYSVMVTNSTGAALSEAVSLTVTAVQVVSSIELTWDIPEKREDGSDLELYEIDGYVIAYGTDESNLSNQLTIEGGQTTQTVLENLESGTYYLAIATVDSDGVQGEYSSIIQQSI